MSAAAPIDQVKVAIAVALATSLDSWCVTQIGDHLRCQRDGAPTIGAVRVEPCPTDVGWRAEPSLIILGREELAAAAQHVCAVRDCLAVVNGALDELGRRRQSDAEALDRQAVPL